MDKWGLALHLNKQLYNIQIDNIKLGHFPFFLQIKLMHELSNSFHVFPTFFPYEVHMGLCGQQHQRANHAEWLSGVRRKQPSSRRRRPWTTVSFIFCRFSHSRRRRWGRPNLRVFICQQAMAPLFPGVRTSIFSGERLQIEWAAKCLQIIYAFMHHSQIDSSLMSSCIDNFKTANRQSLKTSKQLASVTISNVNTCHNDIDQPKIIFSDPWCELQNCRGLAALPFAAQQPPQKTVFMTCQSDQQQKTSVQSASSIESCEASLNQLQF